MRGDRAIKTMYGAHYHCWGGVAWALLCRSLNKHDHAVSCPLVIGWPDRSIDGAGHLTSNESVTTGAWASESSSVGLWKSAFS